MKINGAGLNKVINLYGENKKEINKTAKIERKDSIEISSLGKSLSSISGEDLQIKAQDKIEALRNSVSNGTYKADSTLTAKRMMDILKGREV